MQRYWDQSIIPNTSTKFGLAYELSMVEAGHVMWDFIGDPRYADSSPLTAKAPAGDSIFRC